MSLRILVEQMHGLPVTQLTHRDRVRESFSIRHAISVLIFPAWQMR